MRRPRSVLERSRIFWEYFMSKTELISKIRLGISKQRINRLLENIDNLEGIGAVAGKAYPAASFIIESSPYLACAFSEYTSSVEIGKSINSSTKLSSKAVLPKRNSISKLRTKQADTWMRDFWSTFEPWRSLLGIEIPNQKQVAHERSTLVSVREVFCLLMDFLFSIQDFPFLPVGDFETMEIKVDPSITKFAYVRPIPVAGSDPYEGIPIKDPNPIIGRFFESRPLDLRQLVLIEDLRFYFESILLSVIDWVNRDDIPTKSATLTAEEQRFIDLLVKAKGERCLRNDLATKLDKHPKTIERCARELQKQGFDIRNDKNVPDTDRIPGYYLANWSSFES